MAVKVVDMINDGVVEYESKGYVEVQHICSADIRTHELTLDDTMDKFIKRMIDDAKENSIKVYVNKLSHNGEFILNYLEKSEYIYNKERFLNNEGEYTYVKSKGEIYEIKLLANEKPKTYVNIYDYNKTIPLKDKEISSGFDVDIVEVNSVKDLMDNVVSYSVAMKYMDEMGLAGVTLSSKSFSELKSTVKHFDKLYAPTPESEYNFIHSAYHAGYNYINPEYEGVELGEVISLDVNSMFPSKLRDSILPYGEGVYYEGKYDDDMFLPLYIQRIRIQSAILKEGRLPMINPYKGVMSSGNRYEVELEEPVEITLSGPMLELFLDSYDVYGLEYIDGYKYRASKGNFAEFVNKWMYIKEEADRRNDIAIRTISKMVMNYSYGGFGKRRNRYTNIGEGDDKTVESVTLRNRYLPIAIFITSYAIVDVVTLANKLGDRFVYSDVDSIHLVRSDIPNVMVDMISDYKLGYWKVEGVYDRAKYLKLKTYVQENEDELVIKTAGAGDEIKDKITFDNFSYGLEVDGLIKSTNVPGGAIYKEYTYKI